MGELLGMDEAGVLAAARGFLARGTARRLGGVFDARRLGYRSVLCAAMLDDAGLESFVPDLVAHPGVTHAYLRGWPDGLAPDLPGAPDGESVPNLWFTLAVLDARFEADVAAFRCALGETPLRLLPARRRFKIDDMFEADERDRMEVFPGAGEAIPSTAAGRLDPPADAEQRVVRLLQDNLPLEPEPYRALADAADVEAAWLLQTLTAWQANGTLRRIALVPRRQRRAHTASGMCVWRVPDVDVLAAGRRLAADRAVTHCYQRLSDPTFPFTLYAMIQTGRWEDTQALFVEVSRRAGLSGGRLLCSVRGFKKASMRLFEEAP